MQCRLTVAIRLVFLLPQAAFAALLRGQHQPWHPHLQHQRQSDGSLTLERRTQHHKDEQEEPIAQALPATFFQLGSANQPDCCGPKVQMQVQVPPTAMQQQVQMQSQMPPRAVRRQVRMQSQMPPVVTQLQVNDMKALESKLLQQEGQMIEQLQAMQHRIGQMGNSMGQQAGQAPMLQEQAEKQPPAGGYFAFQAAPQQMSEMQPLQPLQSWRMQQGQQQQPIAFSQAMPMPSGATVEGQPLVMPTAGSGGWSLQNQWGQSQGLLQGSQQGYLQNYEQGLVQNFPHGQAQGLTQGMTTAYLQGGMPGAVQPSQDMQQAAVQPSQGMQQAAFQPSQSMQQAAVQPSQGYLQGMQQGGVQPTQGYLGYLQAMQQAAVQPSQGYLQSMQQAAVQPSQGYLQGMQQAVAQGLQQAVPQGVQTPTTYAAPGVSYQQVNPGLGQYQNMAPYQAAYR